MEYQWMHKETAMYSTIQLLFGKFQPIWQSNMARMEKVPSKFPAIVRCFPIQTWATGSSHPSQANNAPGKEENLGIDLAKSTPLRCPLQMALKSTNGGSNKTIA